MAKYLMVCGTASHVGKSILVTALCRILSDAGYRVAPFKAQNMSLNSYVTKDGAEIGMAQAVQAKAARVEPTAEMNPILLKPKGDSVSQVVLLGKPYADKKAGEYYDVAKTLFDAVKISLRKLSQKYDVIVIEGAGSPAEINLYERDIANMLLARTFDIPVILVGDIERGGVFASLYGTLGLIPETDRKYIRGFIINKFRGEEKLLEPGIRQLEKLTGIRALGVLPYADFRIPSEDSVSLDGKETSNSKIEIVVIRLPRISNFTDFEPLEAEANVRYVHPRDLNLENADAVIIPGTKNTVSDLAALRKYGADRKIRALAGKVPIIGICGGYQILGNEIIDSGVEGGKRRKIRGLGLLGISTHFEKYEKQTKQVTKKVTGGGPILGRVKGEKVRGYEIHMGMSVSKAPVFGDDGCMDTSGLVFGTYLHGIFENANLRSAFLGYLYERKGARRTRKTRRDYFDELASLVKKHVDMGGIYKIAGLR
jgi:adenosylcobyric acid synthase